MSGSASSYYSCLCPRWGSAGWEGRTDGMPGPGRLPRRRGTYPGLVYSISPTSPRMSYQRAMRILFRARPANQIIPNSQTCSSTCDANICKARWRRRPIVCLAALPRLSILQSRRMIQSGIEGTVDQDARVAHSVGISTALFLLSPPRAAAPDRPGNKPHKPRQLRRPSLRSLRLARFNWVAVGPTDRRWRGPCRGAEDVRLVNSTVQAL